jgi:hypothetical protein
MVEWMHSSLWTRNMDVDPFQPQRYLASIAVSYCRNVHCRIESARSLKAVASGATSGIFLLLLCILCCSGCLVVSSTPALVRHRWVEADCARTTHIIIVDSPADPCRIGSLEQLSGDIRRAGFRNVSFFNPWTDGDAEALASKIRGIKQRCDHSKVVLIGWSMGTLWIRDAAARLEPCGVQVDSFINLDSSFYRMQGGATPANICRNLLIYREQNTLPDGVHNARVVRVDESMHLAVPTNWRTVQAILCELQAVSASRVVAVNENALSRI